MSCIQTVRSLRLRALLVSCLLVQTTLAQARTLEKRESQYNSIVVEQRADLITMAFGHNRRLYQESVANAKDPLQLPVAYTRYMTLPMAYAPQPRRVLEIGLGGGTTAWYLHETFPDIGIDAVELDPEVAQLAEKYFSLRPGPRLRVHIGDGRRFMARSRQRYDIILIDAYRGPFVPFHLLTQEFFDIARRKLTQGGVVAQNIEPTTMLYDSAVATIGSVFDQVDVYPARGNFVVIAYDGPPRSNELLLSRAATLDGEFNPGYKLTRMIGSRRVQSRFSAQVLTDDFAPVEALNATQRHNRPRY